MNLTSTLATKLFLALLFLVILFHSAILFKIIPYNIAWGGKLSNDTEMFVFEMISAIFILFLVCSSIFILGRS